jgi:hypothetical protein
MDHWRSLLFERLEVTLTAVGKSQAGDEETEHAREPLTSK